MRYIVRPTHFTDIAPREAVAAFNSLALAAQWAKGSAELEGRGWTYDVCEIRPSGLANLIASYHADGSIDTPNGIAL